MPSTASNLSDPSRYCPRAAAAALFNVSPSAVRGWAERGLITLYRRGGRVYVDVLEIEEALTRHGRRVMRDGRGRYKRLPRTVESARPATPSDRATS
ncbi:helix-turn-helix domain-containing protein [Pseudoclavibacter sp. AY1F1]|uniref:helix-turn-helix domain-containing protein n=1 Tax=Pseudoclavibacter sp. AY1F1 TaxID=2080583 RepID=UPI0011B0EF97|nr:helix-turn-helix domain-containing protein [Pseudoclavibacter sp. AY1F1]